MKHKSVFFALLLPMALVFTACGGPIESFTFKSPKGDRSIDISGKRESPAGPIIVAVTIHIPKGDKSFSFEHQASSMTKETVTANWLNDFQCNVTFKLDDGTAWELETYLLDDKIQAIKSFQLDGKSIFN